MQSLPIASVEIGTHMVRVLVGEHRPDNQLFVTGLGEVESSGVRKGEIVDLDNALAGHIRVVTGWRREAVCPVEVY